MTEIVSHPFFAERHIESIFALPQGGCNETYRVVCKEGDYVYRRKSVCKIDRFEECRIQNLAASVGIGVEVCDCDDEVMIAPFVAGESLVSLQTRDIEVVAHMLKRLHTIGYEGEWVLDERMWKRATVFPFEGGLCHNDLSAGNLIRTRNEEIVLIDFEYAGYNDIYFDLASISVEFALSHARQIRLLRCYFGNEAYNVSKLRFYRTLYKEVCRIWEAHYRLESR